MNNVMLIGRLTRDPELRFTPGGMAVTKFTLAVDKDFYGEKKQEAEAKGLPTADFINITAFGKTAESCANYLNKGNKCAVQGRISTGNYTKDDGTKVYTTEVIADKVEFLESKAERQAKTQDNFNDFPNDEDLFTPADDEDMDSIPF